jgi:hypothetical protein
MCLKFNELMNFAVYSVQMNTKCVLIKLETKIERL